MGDYISFRFAKQILITPAGICQQRQEHYYLEKHLMSPSPPSTTNKGRYESLLEIVSTDDVICIPIVADPDAIASALALKRLFWRKVRKTLICRVNAIKRSDNLAMIRDLKITVP